MASTRWPSDPRRAGLVCSKHPLARRCRNRRRSTSFETLIDEGASADVSGWDFSWLDGRAAVKRPPWRYADRLAERLSAASSSLDIQTGGGVTSAT